MHPFTQPDSPQILDASSTQAQEGILVSSSHSERHTQLAPLTNQHVHQENKQSTIGAYAEKAIVKAFRKMVKHEQPVLQDTDIESLHQMRIGLRRLRTTLQTFESLLLFPEDLQDTKLKPLAKRLGRVRDLDVLLVALCDRYQPHLPKKERKVLKQICGTLQKKRDRQFKRMRRFLHSDDYSALKAGITHWCQHPDQRSPAARWPMQVALPDLLLPVLSQTLLHPGWLTDPFESSEAAQNEQQDAIAVVNQWLDRDGTVLHDLRKQMKQLRYQADFFADQYDETYRQQIKVFKAVQDRLGTLQDAWVLAQTLQTIEGRSWRKRLPSVHKRLQQERWRAWQQWKEIQTNYVTMPMRSRLHHMMFYPWNIHGQP